MKFWIHKKFSKLPESTPDEIWISAELGFQIFAFGGSGAWNEIFTQQIGWRTLHNGSYIQNLKKWPKMTPDL